MKSDFFENGRKSWENRIQNVTPIEYNGRLFERDFAGVKVKKTTTKNELEISESFHNVMKPVVLLGQCFGIMPVMGINSKYAPSLKFSLINIRLLYTIIIIISSAVMAMITLSWIVRQNIDFDRMEPLIWYSTNTITILSFIIVAKRWPALMVDWEKFENQHTIFSEFHHEKMKKSIYTVSIAIPVLSLIEHILSIVNGFYKVYKCKQVSSLIEGYFRQSFPAYYSTFEFNLISASCLQFVNLFTTFAWNFMDNFVIVISYGLAAQFEHFNNHFAKFKNKAQPDEFWGEQRRYYNALCDLTSTVDDNITLITLLSFSNNLFYICLQLFNSFKPSGSIVQSIYFWFSLIFLIGRALLVSFSAARIHDESRKPIEILRLVPTKVYLHEAKRFLEHVTNSTMALSGMRFFYVTRQFILQVIGTVVTYELVLVQLQQQGNHDIDPCNR